MNVQKLYPLINSVWIQINQIKKELQKIKASLQDPKPCKIAKRPQLQVWQADAEVVWAWGLRVGLDVSSCVKSEHLPVLEILTILLDVNGAEEM